MHHSSLLVWLFFSSSQKMCEDSDREAKSFHVFPRRLKTHLFKNEIPSTSHIILFLALCSYVIILRLQQHCQGALLLNHPFFWVVGGSKSQKSQHPLILYALYCYHYNRG